MYKQRVIGHKPEWHKPEWLFLKFSAFFTITALSMNILCSGDKLPMQRAFFQKIAQEIYCPP